MPLENIQNYAGTPSGIAYEGQSSIRKVQVYNSLGADLPNGSVVVISKQFDGTSGYFLLPAQPATSTVAVEVGIVAHMDPNVGNPYSGIKAGDFGFVQTFGYCDTALVNGATTQGHYIDATNGQYYVTDTATLDAKAFGTILTATSGAGSTDVYLFGIFVTI